MCEVVRRVFAWFSLPEFKEWIEYVPPDDSKET